MQSIGERLAEARKQKGIPLREAADSLNIGGNILDCFENDHFDIGLPEIFVRGFLKNYAQFLGIDPARILKDYSAFKKGESTLASKDRGELLGRLDLPSSSSSAEESAKEDSEKQEPSPAWGFSSEGPGPRFTDSSGTLDTDTKVDYTIYWKLGFAAAGLLAVLVLLIYIVWNVLSGPEPDLNPQAVETSTPIAVPSAEPSEETILLLASGDVEVMVKEDDTGTQLYRGALSAGDRVEIVKTGPVTIAFSEGKFLEYEQGGQRFQPQSQGLGRMTVP